MVFAVCIPKKIQGMALLVYMKSVATHLILTFMSFCRIWIQSSGIYCRWKSLMRCVRWMIIPSICTLLTFEANSLDFVSFSLTMEHNIMTVNADNAAFKYFLFLYKNLSDDGKPILVILCILEWSAVPAVNLVLWHVASHAEWKFSKLVSGVRSGFPRGNQCRDGILTHYGCHWQSCSWLWERMGLSWFCEHLVVYVVVKMFPRSLLENPVWTFNIIRTIFVEELKIFLCSKRSSDRPMAFAIRSNENTKWGLSSSHLLKFLRYFPEYLIL